MAVILPDDVTVSPVGGAVLSEVAVDLTTRLGVYVQLRGVAATPATSECFVTYGSTTVELTDTPASGEVTASLTAADLITLGAGIGSVVTAWLQGTVTDGAVTHAWRYQMSLRVSDRVMRFPFDYNRFTAVLTPFGRACSYPDGQTNHWPQIRVGLEDLRDDINSQHGDVKTAFLANEGLLRKPAFIYGVESALRASVIRTNANLQTSALAYELSRYEKMRASVLGETIVSLRSSDAWKTEGTTGERAAKRAGSLMGVAGGIGGAL